MKKYIFFNAIVAAAVLMSISANAQKPESQDKKTEEIVIRKNGNNDAKMIIEINGDSITVNGKPLSEYKGDELSVITRDYMKRNSQNFLISPDNDNDMNLSFSHNDDMMRKPRTFLGVITEKATDGVKITNVIKGSGAEKADLLKDDIITGVNDKKIISPEDLMEAIKSYKPDENVKISYLRNNKKKDVKVKLGETMENRRPFIYRDDNHAMNGNNFNFKMPKMPNLPNYNYNYNYKLGEHNPPKLGIKIEDTENDMGAKILNVEEGSAADKAGLKKDDVITEIDGEKVNDVDDIKQQLDEGDDKTSLKLKANRNNTEMNFEIKIPKELNKADL